MPFMQKALLFCKTVDFMCCKWYNKNNETWWNIIHLGYSNFAIQIIYKDSINIIGSYLITFSILFLEVSNRRVVNTHYFQRTA